MLVCNHQLDQFRTWGRDSLLVPCGTDVISPRPSHLSRDASDRLRRGCRISGASERLTEGRHKDAIDCDASEFQSCSSGSLCCTWTRSAKGALSQLVVMGVEKDSCLLEVWDCFSGLKVSFLEFCRAGLLWDVFLLGLLHLRGECEGERYLLGLRVETRPCNLRDGLGDPSSSVVTSSITSFV